MTQSGQKKTEIKEVAKLQLPKNEKTATERRISGKGEKTGGDRARAFLRAD